MATIGGSSYSVPYAPRVTRSSAKADGPSSAVVNSTSEAKLTDHAGISKTTRAINKEGWKILAEHSLSIKVLPYSFSDYERFLEEGDPDLFKVVSYDVFGDSPGIVLSRESLEHETGGMFLLRVIDFNPALVQNLRPIVFLSPGQREISLIRRNGSFIPDFSGRLPLERVPHIIFEVNAYERTPQAARRKMRGELVAMRGTIRLGVLLKYYHGEEIWRVEVYRYVTRANKNGEHLILPQGLDAVERPFINAALSRAHWRDTTYIQNNAAYQLWPSEDGFQIPLSAYDWFSDRFNEASRDHNFTPQTHVPLTADLFAVFWRLTLDFRAAERERQEREENERRQDVEMLDGDESVIDGDVTNEEETGNFSEESLPSLDEDEDLRRRHDDIYIE